MANKIFPTGYGDVSTTLTLGGFVYVDDGSKNGYVTTDELFKLLLSSSSYVFKEGSPHGVGLVPDPGATGGTTRYLREDGTWDVPPAGSIYTPPGNFGPSGPGHAYGFVPDPGATAGTTHFLREDGSWVVPPVGPIYSTFVGSGSTHAIGLVPDPGSVAGTTRFLREDGTFAVPAGGGGGGSTMKYAPGWGSCRSSGSWNRPALSSVVSFNLTGSPEVLTEFTDGPIRMTCVTTSSTWKGFGLTTTTSEFTGTLFVTADVLAAQSTYYGVVVANTVSGNFLVMAWQSPGGNTPPNFTGFHYNNFTGGTGFAGGVTPIEAVTVGDPTSLHWKAAVSAGVLSIYYAKDPLDDAGWQVLYQESLSSFLIAPNFFGLAVDGGSAYAPIAANVWGLTIT